MKTKLLLVLLFGFISVINAQITLIPDQFFEQYLIDKGIDSDNTINGQVFTDDIKEVTQLHIGIVDNIIDLTGIEGFAALTHLYFQDNPLKNLNISQNTNLEVLSLSGTQIESINTVNNTKLTELSIFNSNNTLTSLSVSSNVNLISLNVSGSKLTSIDLSGNVNLTDLSLASNNLASLDVSNNIKLVNLDCSNNNLTALDVTKLINLEDLDFSKNNVIQIDLSKNTKIEKFYANENKLSSLDFIKNISLNRVECEKNELSALNLKNGNSNQINYFSSKSNPNLICILVDDRDYSYNNSSWYKDATSVFVEECKELTSIPDANFELRLESLGLGNGINNDGYVETDKISSLKDLDISDKNITDLTGIDEFIELTHLDASDNTITNVDFTKNINLENLNVFFNSISTINVSKNTKLKELHVGRNQLKSLDITNLTVLEKIWCFANQLTALDLSKNKELILINCSSNLLENLNVYSNTKLTSIDAFVNKLKYFDIQNNVNVTQLSISDNELIGLNLKNGNNNKINLFTSQNNTNLTCIKVDDVAFSTNNWTNIDAHSSFSLDCIPVNDDCANAIPLTFGQQTPGDVNSGNANNNAACVTGNVLADVWFSLQVPQTGEFSIQGTGFGGQLKFAVYENCSNSASIACGENISLTNLTIGAELYVKAWIEITSNKSANNQSEIGTFTLIAQESSVLSVDNFSTSINQLNVYPNPAKSNINIDLSSEKIIQNIAIYSILGDKVITKNNANKSKISVDVSSISKGIYILRANVDNKIISKKLIIQ